MSDSRATEGEILRIDGVRVSYGSGQRAVSAVDDVSFTLRHGEIMGLVGESGSGKSTLVKALIGLLPDKAKTSSAPITFRGSVYSSLDDPKLIALRGSEIGMVFQDPLSALNPVYMVGRQIGEGLPLHGRARRKRVLELMNQVGIADPERRYRAYPHELSGGLRQRVAIAISLAREPSLLLADEPTTALDVTIQRQILQLLTDLARSRGMAMIIVTHDLGVVAQTCDRVGVMYAGRLVETGSVSEVLLTPRHPYTEGLIASLPRGRGGTELDPIKGMPPKLASPETGCSFAPRCQYAEARCTTEAVGWDNVDGHATACRRIHELGRLRGVTANPST